MFSWAIWTKIDYVLFGQKHKTAIILTEAYTRGHFESYHNPIIIKVRFEIKLISTNINTSKLRDTNG